MTRIISIVGGLQPSTPTIGTATAGDTTASVAFTPSTYIGKGTITYTATSSPGGFTGTASSSPITVTGLSNGTAYTFTVTGTTNYGVTSLASGSSNSVTPALGDVGSMFPIGAVTVGSAGATSITFSNIPQTYTHLQIRGLNRGSSASFDQIYAQINSDTGANYSNHALYGDGSNAGAFGTANGNQFSIAVNTGSSQPTGAFGVQIIDILDYKNTNKYKTLRGFSGANGNTAQGFTWIASGSWRNTNAVTSIKLERLVSGSNNPFVEYSTFALYGIKGA
jgi:hypothetical protein